MAKTKPTAVGEPRRSGRERKKPSLLADMVQTVSGRRGRPAGVTKKTSPKKTGTQKRKPTVKDKVEGTLKKAEGAVTKSPGKKAAGTKQKKGTDGKAKRGRPSLKK